MRDVVADVGIAVPVLEDAAVTGGVGMVAGEDIAVGLPQVVEEFEDDRVFVDFGVGKGSEPGDGQGIAVGGLQPAHAGARVAALAEVVDFGLALLHIGEQGQEGVADGIDFFRRDHIVEDGVAIDPELGDFEVEVDVLAGEGHDYLSFNSASSALPRSSTRSRSDLSVMAWKPAAFCAAKSSGE